MNRSLKDCIFSKILLVKEDKLLLPVTWRDFNFFISISTLKYQSLYAAKKLNTANLVGTNEKEVKATVAKI